MIGLKINNTHIALKPETALDVEINNSLFDTEIMLGEFALPFEASKDGNNKTLGYFHDLLLQTRNKTFPDSQLQYKGLPLYKGIADILESSDEKFSISMRLNFSGLNCISRKLKDFDYDGLVTLGTDMATVLDYLKDNCSLGYPVVNFNFPTIYNPNFYDGKNPDYENFINYFDSDSAVYYDSTASNRQTIIPMLYLHYIIKCGFAYDGYTVVNAGFMADTDMQKLMVYNNRALDQLGGSAITYTPDSCHVTCSSSQTINSNSAASIQFDDETTSGNFDNGSNFGGNAYTIPTDGNYFIKSKLYYSVRNNPNPGVADTVEIRIKVGATTVYSTTKTYYGVNGIITEQITYNYNAGVPNIGQQIKIELYYLNGQYPTAYLDVLSSCYISVNEFTTVNSNINEFQKTFDPVNHVPDITFMELLNSIRKTFNLTFQFDHTLKRVSILYYSNIVTQTPVDLTDKELIGHKIKNNRENLYKLFNYNFGSNDSRTSDNFLDYNDDDFIGEFNNPNEVIAAYPPDAIYFKKKVYIKCLHQIWECKETAPSTYAWQYYTDAYFDFISNPEGSIEIKPNFHPAMMVYLDDYPNNASVVMPYIDNIGTSPEYALGENPYDFQMFFYHGLVDVNSSQAMPTASSCKYSLTGDNITNIALQWNEINLISLWSQFLAIVQKGDFFVKRFRMNIYDFLRYNITDLFRWGQTTFLAKKTRFSISSEFAETETEFYKL